MAAGSGYKVFTAYGGRGDPLMGQGAERQDPGASYDPLIQQLQAQLAQEPAQRYSDEEVKQRRSDNDREYNLGLLASMVNLPGFSGVGGMVLKKALGDAQVRETDRGTYDPIEGRYTLHPEVQRAELQKKLEGFQSAKAGAVEKAEDKAAQRDADYRRSQDAIRERAYFANLVQGANGGGGPGGPNAAMQQFGYDSGTGKRVLTARNGMQYTLDVGPNGQPNWTPYTGQAIPNATWEKQAAGAQEASFAADRAKGLIGAIKKNPESFGMQATAQGYVPLPGWFGAATLNDDQMEARAGVLREAAEITHAIYGAAQSRGEEGKAIGFVVQPNDPPETAIAKMHAALRYAQAQSGQYGTGVSGAVAARRGVPTAAGAAGGPAMPSTDAIDAELARRAAASAGPQGSW